MKASTMRIRRLAPALLVLLILLVACGSAASGPQEVPAADLGAPRDDATNGEGGDAARPGGEQGEPGSQPDVGGEEPLAAPAEQRIVKTGEITLEVENVGSAIGQVRAMATELGGYVGGSQAGTLDDRATLTIRIPAPQFDEALVRLHEMDAEVIAEATREQDVTGQVVDLEARIDNLRSSEASYRELVARAERVEDILAVQSRLDEVRGQIEQLQAQLDVLEGQADLSTLTISLIPRAQPIEQQAEVWDPAAQLDRALASLVGIGQAVFDGLVWFVVVWLPILLVLGAILLLALRGVLEVRRRMPVNTVRAQATGGDEGTA